MSFFYTINGDKMKLKNNSKLIKKGDTFIAIKGIENDGHKYVLEAIKNGASKLIVMDKKYNIKTKIVKDTKKYLVNYLKNKYQYLFKKMKIIGVTGTNGKTTTSYLLYQSLNKIGFKTSYIGTTGFYLNKKQKNLKNTTPDLLEIYELLIKSYENNCEYVVLEVSSQGLSNGRVDGIIFDYAIFTNLTLDHLDFHKTMENYAISKQKIFKNLKGKAIINIDDKYKNYFLLENNKNITYGFKKSDYQILSFHTSKMGNIFYLNDMKIQSNLIGKFNIYNLIPTIIILKDLNIEENLIIQTIKSLEEPPGRMQLINYQNNKIVIDYAHTPDAIYQLFTSINCFLYNNIYVVFGCTGNREKTKRPIMMKLINSVATKTIVTSDNTYKENIDNIISDIINDGKKYL